MLALPVRDGAFRSASKGPTPSAYSLLFQEAFPLLVP